MDTRLNKNYFLVGMMLFVASCAPVVPIYQSDHDNPNPLAILETNELTVKLQHLGNQYGYYVFDLEIINNGAQPFTFSPQEVEYYASSKMFPEISLDDDLYNLSYSNSELIKKKIYAQSPASVRASIESRERRMATTQTIFAIISIGAMVYDGVQDAKDYKKERWTQRDINRSVNRDALVASSLLIADATNGLHEQAKTEAYYLPHELFPETQFDTYSHQRGKIFLPAESSFRYMRLVIPVSDKDCVFDFKRKSAKGKELKNTD